MLRLVPLLHPRLRLRLRLCRRLRRRSCRRLRRRLCRRLELLHLRLRPLQGGNDPVRFPPRRLHLRPQGCLPPLPLDLA